MGFLFDLLFGLVFEGTLSAKKEKVGLGLRIPLILLIAVVTGGIITAVAIFGFYVLGIKEDSSQHAAGIGLLLLDTVFIVSGISKAVKHIRRMLDAKKRKKL